MRRFHEEENIAKRRARLHRQLYGYDPATSGKYRKTKLGCLTAGCLMCKPGKRPKRIPTRQEINSNGSINDFGGRIGAGRSLLLVAAGANEGRRSA